jgi:hypothetical protein
MAAPALALSMQFEPLRTLDYTVITGGYMGIGTALDHPARQILVQNLTDVLLVFSTDGINDHFVLPANGFLLSDITSNKTQQGGFYLAEGSRLYVNTVTGDPTKGGVYFTVVYGYGF